MARGLTRSALFVPCDHARAMEKAKTLPADILIFDLEDGVSPAHKLQAREAAIEAISSDAYHHATRVVRTNSLHSAWGKDDVLALAVTLPDAMMLPKVESAAQVQEVVNILAAQDRADMPIWCNIETPRGVLNAAEIATHPNVRALVAGTNDLGNDLNIIRTPDRAALLHSLSHLILAAKASGRLVLDGTYIQFDKPEGLEAEAQQGRMLGFDGKTLVHPSQIDVVNRTFSPSAAEIARSLRLIEAYEAAMREGREVLVFEGGMIERLHYERAKQLQALATLAK